ncbi:uncharacterized protein LOC142975512 [Anticarsia gemmatalis]|uniref:uncharacterized protein LOC142975512 n=1 Tax=Anticarsia gemmatalis TaxID=129554 RepID=UPI003F75AC39
MSITEIIGASNMKVFVISVLCALVGHAAAGAIGWPGAVPLSSASVLQQTIISPPTKTTAYATSPFVNALPSSYIFAAAPQFAYHVPQVNHFAPYHPGYLSLAGPAHIPAANIYYPAQPAFPVFGSVAPPTLPSIPSGPPSPAFPGHPQPPHPPQPPKPILPGDKPSPPQHQPAGDADSAVIESAEFAGQRQENPQTTATPDYSTPQSTEAPAPQYPISTFPNFPGIPQIPQEGQTPSFPQFPQNPTEQGQTPSFPSNPQFGHEHGQSPAYPTYPQFPQESGQSPSFPSFPQTPQIPSDSTQGQVSPSYPQEQERFPQFPGIPQNIFSQGPSQAPASSFPGASNVDQGLNDEDTVSVESA